ncbi:MAG: EamA family transporter [Tepidiformaceae bacterium]
MGELAALLSALTWSGTSVALTSLSARTSPVALSALRLAAGTIVLCLLVVVVGAADDVADASAANLAAIIGSGLIGYGLGDTLYIRTLALLGMQRTFTISMSLFIALTVGGGVLLLDEPFKWGLVAGGLLIAAGTYLIVVRRGRAAAAAVVFAADAAETAGAALPPTPARPTPAARLRALEGYFLLLAVGIAWAAATLWLAGGRGEVGAIATGALRAPAGAVALLGFGLATQRHNITAPFHDKRHIGAIVAAGIVGTAFGSLLYVYAVLEAGAARTVLLSATAPLMGLPLSIIFLREAFTARVASGTALCTAGILLIVV